jgi:hypothetical protein
MWSGHNQEAIAKFEQVRRLFPHQSEVDALIQSAQQAIDAGPSIDFGKGVVAVVVALALAACVVLVKTLRGSIQRRPTTESVVPASVQP